MSDNKATRDFSALYVPGAIVVAGAIIGLSLIIALKGSAPATGTATGQPQVAVNIKDVKTDGSPYIGRADAPVTLAYWFDYQCPYCKAVDVGGISQIPIEPAMPRLIEEYVSTGKLKIVYKDYAFLSEDSSTAALYGRAVWDLYPEKYLEWHKAMMTAQDEEHGGFGNEASILQLSGTIPGIDADALKARIAQKGNEYEQMIAADRDEGAAFGISGTPGFITGETLIPGAAEFSRFQSVIDAQL